MVGALELERIEAVKNKSIDISELHPFIALALLGASVALPLPWLDAFLAEERLAAAALQWLLHDIHADGAHKEHGLLFILVRFELNLFKIEQ